MKVWVRKVPTAFSAFSFFICICRAKDKSKAELSTEWYNDFIENETLDKLIIDFRQKGGRINSYYLTNPRRNPALVFYKRWYRGRNIREAIKRALAS